MDTGATHDFLSLVPEDIIDFQLAFNKIADTLMNSYMLKVGETMFQLTEIEFYYNCKEHPDIFAHSDETQLTCGQWYFHRTGNSFRGGNYKGLDITFGVTGYGGILIRAMKNQQTGEYVDGPCKVVDKILSITGFQDLNSLVGDEKFHHDVFSLQTSILSLIPTPFKTDRIIYQSARFGLTLRNHQQSSFVMKPYRYLSAPLEMKKGKQHLVLELAYQGHNVATISQITKSTPKQCEKWIEWYRKGCEGDRTVESYFGKSLKVDEFSEFYGVMKSKDMR
ncbi:Hypothetical protein POVR1_LOCUS467 [uncultured virus]|nr:Hypothetical protein POVR1_LOCUS467 [uncultured virus]